MIRINLLPVKKAHKQQSGMQQLMLMGAAVAVTVIVLGVYNLKKSNDITSVEEEIAADEAEIARLEKIIGEVNQFEEQKKKLQQQLKVIEELEKGKAGPVKVMDALATSLPKRVWITSFTERNGQASIDGYGLEMADVSEFLKALEKSPHFTEVQLRFTQNSPQKGINTFQFSLATKINYTL